MTETYIIYPESIDKFIKLIVSETGAAADEVQETVEHIWRLYCTHRAEKNAHTNELDPQKQKKARKILKQTQAIARTLHKELTGPELRETFEAIMGPDYEKVEDMLHNGISAIAVKYAKRPRGAPGEWGLTYGARILIDKYKKWTGRKATIVHAGDIYSGPIFIILSKWTALTGFELSDAGVNSLFNRAKRMEY